MKLLKLIKIQKSSFLRKLGIKLACVSSSFGNSLFACSSSGDQLPQTRLGLTEQGSCQLKGAGKRALTLGAVPRIALHKPSKCLLPTTNKNLNSFALSNKGRFFSKPLSISKF